MPSSKELLRVTDKSIADIFINLGLATSRLTTYVKEIGYAVGNVRGKVRKKTFAKNMEEYGLAKHESFLR